MLLLFFLKAVIFLSWWTLSSLDKKNCSPVLPLNRFSPKKNLKNADEQLGSPKVSVQDNGGGYCCAPCVYLQAGRKWLGVYRGRDHRCRVGLALPCCELWRRWQPVQLLYKNQFAYFKQTQMSCPSQRARTSRDEKAKIAHLQNSVARGFDVVIFWWLFLDCFLFL